MTVTTYNYQECRLSRQWRWSAARCLSRGRWNTVQFERSLLQKKSEVERHITTMSLLLVSMSKLSHFTASIKFSKQIFYNREKCRPPVFCVGFKWPIFHGKLCLVMGPPGSWAKWVLNTNSPLIWWILDCFDMCRVIVQGVITLSNKDNLLYSQGRWYRAGAMCCQTSRAGMKLSRERLRDFLSICSPYLGKPSKKTHFFVQPGGRGGDSVTHQKNIFQNRFKALANANAFPILGFDFWSLKTEFGLSIPD